MSNAKDGKNPRAGDARDAEPADAGLPWSSPWPKPGVIASRAMATKSTSAATSGRAASAGKTAAPRKRAEQQRAQSTRTAILEAALAEFAERGFEAASIRSIAERTGFQHPLITYHYPSKDLLWQAVAEDTFERIRREWMSARPRKATCRRSSASEPNTAHCSGTPRNSRSSIVS